VYGVPVWRGGIAVLGGCTFPLESEFLSPKGIPMKKQRSLIRTIQLSMWLLSSVLVIVLGYLWLSEEIKRSQSHERRIRETYLTDQKETLKTEVEHVIDFISHKKAMLEKRTKKEVQARTQEAYQTALYIYEQNKGDKSLAEISQLIHDALYSVSWNEGKGYYFAISMDGKMLINRNNPEFEDQGITNIQNSSRKYLMSEILTAVRSENKEGFCTYPWNRPEHPGELVPKISYVKFFEPLDWVIGNGMYLEDEEKKIKQEVIKRLEEIRFGNNRYLFSGTWEGITLSGPAKGENMWESTDANGLKIVQALVEKAKGGGGFIEYVMPKIDGKRPFPKISYSGPVPEWQWYVGTGVYVDYIEDVISRQQEVLNKSVQRIIIQTVLVLCLFLIISYILTWLFAAKIKNNLDLFLEFFRRSAFEKLTIQSDKVFFHEFQSLALSANQMAEDRQQAWTDLTEEQERLAVTLHSIGDGVITTDTEGNVVLLNKVAEKLTGWSNAEAQGKPATEIFNIINEKSGEKCESPTQKVLESGKKVGLADHTSLLVKDGSHRSIADSAAPIRNSEGKTIGVVLVFRDVTNEKKMAKEILKIRKLESVGVLAGGIAHDFNNILSAILGNVQLASHMVGTQHKALPLLEEAKKASNRAAKLTQQLLTFAKGGEPIKETTSLPQIIRESADFILHGSQVSCEYNYPEDLWPVEVDSGQMGQVIQNIVLNAIYAMPDGGQIRISCSNIENAASETLLDILSGNYVKVSIKDSGTGISAKVLEKIFDPYFTTKQEGSGLGLAICHSIISKHNGHILSESTPGKGTTFNIYLPAVFSTDNQKKGEDEENIAPLTGPLKIMVMDDNKMLRNVARAQLSHLGHDAILVSCGDEALDKYKELLDSGETVDLFIMDLTIPGGMGGAEATQLILEHNPEAKIIVSSGYSTDPIMANFQEYGFSGSIAKPLDLEKLEKTIHSVMTD
jgi:PAS domain S-box-containing protein